MRLTDFLLARIADDEAAIGTQIPVPDTVLIKVAPGVSIVHNLGAMMYPDAMTVGRRRVSVRIDKDRLLAECEAKRQLVEDCRDSLRHEPLAERALWYLALPYADHPDYRQEWKL